MIAINGSENEFILDLNQSSQDEYEVFVLSVDENGSSLPWKYDYVSSPYISLKPSGLSNLKMTFDLIEIKEDEHFILINSKKEILNVTIKPNKEMSTEKDYRFNVSKHTESGKTVTVKIVSRENNKYTPWSVRYDGKPLKFSINPKRGTGDSEVTLYLCSIVGTECTSVVIFKQDKSGLCLQLKLRFPDNNTAIIDDIIQGCNL